MGMQVPCGMDTEMPAEAALWGVAKYLGNLFHELARERESRILEGHLCPDHARMLIEIPPKYPVARVVPGAIVPALIMVMGNSQDYQEDPPRQGQRATPC
jgi:REP element-mobilizing transposase RayT